MTNYFTLSLTNQPIPANRDFIKAGLYQFNLARSEPDQYQPLDIYLHDEERHLMGGLIGGTYWGWLLVEIFWLAEDARGLGWGKRIMALAEEEALRRGCKHAHLDTIEFQAPAFYESLGYRQWGVLEDLPPGHRRIFYRKDLHV